VLEDGTVVVVKSSAEVSCMHPSLKQQTSAGALSTAAAALAVNQALAHPRMYIYFLLRDFLLNPFQLSVLQRQELTVRWCDQMDKTFEVNRCLFV
jgi:hypothetical protein